MVSFSLLRQAVPYNQMLLYIVIFFRVIVVISLIGYSTLLLHSDQRWFFALNPSHR